MTSGAVESVGCSVGQGIPSGSERLGHPIRAQLPSGNDGLSELAIHRVRGRRYADGLPFERITIDPDRMGGMPRIRDLRVTVSTVLGQLAGGSSIDDVLSDYPYLEEADVLAALEYAAAVVNEREVPVARPA